jgi:hypothetical protein
MRSQPEQRNSRSKPAVFVKKVTSAYSLAGKGDEKAGKEGHALKGCTGLYGRSTPPPLNGFSKE